MSEYDEEPMLTEREVAQRTNTSPRTWQNRRGAGNGPRYMLEAQRAFFDGHPERVSALLADRERTDATCGDAWEDSPRGDARQVFWDYLRERKVKIHNINIVNDALHRVAEVVAAAALSKVG